MPERDDFYEDGLRGSAMSWGMPGQRVGVGQWRGGLVVGCRKRQATEYGTGMPKFKETNGKPDQTKPVHQLIITVISKERDPNSPTDDGMRDMYITKESLYYAKDNKVSPGQKKEGVLFGALTDAMAAAGVPQTLPEAGGYYYQCLLREEPGQAAIPRAIWAANYQRPTPESLAELARLAPQGVSQPVADEIYAQQGAPSYTQPTPAPAVPQYQPTPAPAVPQYQPTPAPAVPQYQPAPPMAAPVYAQQTNGAAPPPPGQPAPAPVQHQQPAPAQAPGNPFGAPPAPPQHQQQAAPANPYAAPPPPPQH